MRTNARAVIGRLKAKLDRVMIDLEPVLGNEGQRYFSEEFRRGEFDGQKWPEVKRRIPGTQEYKYPKKKGLSRRTLPKLVGRTRRLKNAVATSYKPSGKSMLKWEITGEVGKYAAIQNYGGKVNISGHTRNKTITTTVKGNGYFSNGKFKKGKSKKLKLLGDKYSVRGSSFIMPKRQFMGASAGLKRRLMMKADIMFKSVLR